MIIEKDGDSYCVHSDGFINLQESDEYFFINKEEYESFISGITNRKDTLLVSDIKRYFKKRITYLKDKEKDDGYWVDFFISGELDSNDITKLTWILGQYPGEQFFTIYAADSENVGILIEDKYKWRDKQNNKDSMNSEELGIVDTISDIRYGENSPLKVDIVNPNNHSCADCGQPAKYKVFDYDGDIWYYCGACSIGG